MNTTPTQEEGLESSELDVELQFRAVENVPYERLRRLATECRDLTPSAWPPRHATVWIDTEFNGWGGELISLALVDDHDRQFYEAVPCEHPQPWVAEHVLPVLGTRPRSLRWLQQHLHWWLSAYDSVHIVADWPDDIAYFCRALIIGPGERLNTPALTFEIRRDLDAVSAIPHNALEDAKAMRARHLQITGPGPRRVAPWPAEGTSQNASAARAGDEGAVAAPACGAGCAGVQANGAPCKKQTSDTGSAGVGSASGASCAAAERPGQPGGAPFFADECANSVCPQNCSGGCVDRGGR